MLNERLSILEDEEIIVDFPRIPKSQFQYLLIYEATESLHKIKIKEKIIDFLIDKGADNITAHVNSSIYFTLDKNIYTEFKKLNAEFTKHITPLETSSRGKLFWVFNQISYYTFKSEPDLKGSAMIGKGNKTLKDIFEGEVLNMREKKKKPKTN